MSLLIAIVLWTSTIYAAGWVSGSYYRRCWSRSPSVTPLRGAATPPDDIDPTANVLESYSETMRVGYPMDGSSPMLVQPIES